MATLLSQTVLYALGPFFSYPWKPLINYFKGCSYADSYKHFWDQHKCPSNQAWHYVCLYFQAFSNFAFLSAIDAALFYYYPVLSFLVDRPFSVLTLIMWSLCLMSAPSSCPIIVKLLSLVHLLLAYRYAPHFVNAPLELYAIGGFAVVTLIHLLVSKKKLVATSEIALYLSLILLKIISLYYLEKMYGGVLKKLDSELLVVFSVIMIGLCCLKDPVKGSVVFGSFGASTLSVLIGRPALLLLSYAYSASILQGLAHALSREQATLLKLQTEADRDQKITYEWGHVVYFPNLLLHSIYTTLSKKSTKKL